MVKKATLKSFLVLQTPDKPDVSVRSIVESDNENLRRWKNDHRGSFFFQAVISADDQKAWFRQYEQRDNDHMFVVEKNGEPVGCLGYRWLENGEADIYNVILGNKQFERQGVMSQALSLVTEHISKQSGATIGMKVLKSNPAVAWYRKNGFQIVSEQPDHYEMKR